MMSKIGEYLLWFTGCTFRYKGETRFNKWNPLAYLALWMYIIGCHVAEIWNDGCDGTKEAIHDSKIMKEKWEIEKRYER